MVSFLHNKLVANKKAFIFSLISIMVVLLFGLIVGTYVLEKNETIDSSFVLRANAINNYHELLKIYYLPSILKVSGSSALHTMLNYTYENDKFMLSQNFTSDYRSLLENGSFSLYGVNSDLNLMENKTLKYFTDVFSRIGTESYSLDLNITPYYESIIFYQQNPWEVIVFGEFNITFIAESFSIKDERVPISTTISLIGLVDPYYYVHSNGVLNNTYTNYTEIINDWNLTVLNDSIYLHRYYLDDNGPTFLMRMQNLTGVNNLGGASSFIDPMWVKEIGGPLESYNLTSKRRSYMDYHFFNNSFSDCFSTLTQEEYLYNLTNITDYNQTEGFRLDFDNLVRFMGDDFDVNSVGVACGSGVIN